MEWGGSSPTFSKVIFLDANGFQQRVQHGSYRKNCHIPNRESSIDLQRRKRSIATPEDYPATG
eukprot:1234478-Ditylum_brightwellii.AAC.1